MISYIVCASVPTGVWHRRIKYIRAHSEPDISQAKRILTNQWDEDTSVIIRVFPIDSSTLDSQLPSPSEMWQEGLHEQELREYLDA